MRWTLGSETRTPSAPLLHPITIHVGKLTCRCDTSLQDEGGNTSDVSNASVIIITTLHYGNSSTDFLSLPISAQTILLSLLSASRALTPLPSSASLSLIKRARHSVWLV